MFLSQDGSALVTVFQGSRPTGTDPGAQEAAARATFVAEGGTPTYEVHTNDQFVLTGYSADGKVFYEFRHFGTDAIGGFTFRYLRSNKAVSDLVLTDAYQTFDSGNL